MLTIHTDASQIQFSPCLLKMSHGDMHHGAEEISLVSTEEEWEPFWSRGQLRGLGFRGSEGASRRLPALRILLGSRKGAHRRSDRSRLLEHSWGGRPHQEPKLLVRHFSLGLGMILVQQNPKVGI